MRRIPEVEACESRAMMSALPPAEIAAVAEIGLSVVYEPIYAPTPAIPTYDSILWELDPAKRDYPLFGPFIHDWVWEVLGGDPGMDQLLRETQQLLDGTRTLDDIRENFPAPP